MTAHYLRLSSLFFISSSSVPAQCRLTSPPVMCRARCLWALGWSSTVRTNSVSLQQRIAGTKTTGLWQLRRTLLTSSTWRKERWWENTKTHYWENEKGFTQICIDFFFFKRNEALHFCLEQKLNSVSKTDSGMYRCESSNSVGAPKSCVAQQLQVRDCKWFSASLMRLFH